MPAEFSSKLSKDILDAFFNGGTTTFDSDSNGNPGLFVALTASQTAVDGTMAGEISGSGYAREAVTFGTAATENTGAGSAEISNTTQVVFDGFTGTIAGVDGFAICDGSTQGVADALCYGSISEIQIDNGDTVTFAIGAIDISVD